jgi:pullulanase
VLGYYEANDPSQGIGEVIRYVKKFALAAGLENITYSLELLTDNRYDAINDTNSIDASGCWYDPLLFEGVSTANSGVVSAGLIRALDTRRDFASDKCPVVYLENHDHTALVVACGGRQRWWNTQPLAIALFTTAGAIFLHNGQEFGEDYAVPDSGPNRVLARPLRWAKTADPIGEKIRALYMQLIRIRQENPVLSGGNFYPDTAEVVPGHFNSQGYGADSARGLVIYHRWGNDPDGGLMRYIVALNYSGTDQTVTIPFSENGAWTNLMNGDILQIGDYAFPGYVLTSHWGAIFRLVG